MGDTFACFCRSRWPLALLFTATVQKGQLPPDFLAHFNLEGVRIHFNVNFPKHISRLGLWGIFMGFREESDMR
jgi:hypothetical protein